MKTFTLQDLKDNRESIIEYHSDYPHVDLKTFMQFLVDRINFGINEGEDLMEWVSEANEICRPTSRRVSQMAERQAELVFQGKMKEFDTKKYWDNKLR